MFFCISHCFDVSPIAIVVPLPEKLVGFLDVHYTTPTGASLRRQDTCSNPVVDLLRHDATHTSVVNRCSQSLVVEPVLELVCFHLLEQFVHTECHRASFLLQLYSGPRSTLQEAF